MAWIEAPASHAKAAGNSDSPGPDATAPVLDSMCAVERSVLAADGSSARANVDAAW